MLSINSIKLFGPYLYEYNEKNTNMPKIIIKKIIFVKDLILFGCYLGN